MAFGNIKFHLVVFFSLMMGFAPSWAATPVHRWEWILTTDQARWVTQPHLDSSIIKPDVPLPADNIVIDPQATDQPIIGWGGCFNELGWKALLTLSPEDRAAVLRSIFDPKGDGLHLNLCRMPIGASDFALDGYSLVFGCHIPFFPRKKLNPQPAERQFEALR